MAKLIKTILIVEDERPLVRVLEIQLVKGGFKVLVAFDGQEAMDICRKQKPDFILLDLLLPRLSGSEFLRKLRQDAELKNIPVLVLTNLVDDRIMIELNQLDIIDYLVKSNIRLNSVIDIVKKYFKKKNNKS